MECLVCPFQRGVDLPRSPATIRLLAPEVFFDNVRILGHRTSSEQEDRHSLGFSLMQDLTSFKPRVSKMGILAWRLAFVTVSFWDTQQATGRYPRLPLLVNSQ